MHSDDVTDDANVDCTDEYVLQLSTSTIQHVCKLIKWFSCKTSNSNSTKRSGEKDWLLHTASDELVRYFAFQRYNCSCSFERLSWCLLLVGRARQPHTRTHTDRTKERERERERETHRQRGMQAAETRVAKRLQVCNRRVARRAWSSQWLAELVCLHCSLLLLLQAEFTGCCWQHSLSRRPAARQRTNIWTAAGCCRRISCANTRVHAWWRRIRLNWRTSRLLVRCS